MTDIREVVCSEALPLGAVHQGDSVTLLKGLPSDSVHAIISDIPYGIGIDSWDVLHSNTNSAYRGASPAQTRSGAIFKSRGKPINGWSAQDRLIPKQYYDWCTSWASEWYRVLKPGGSALVFAGRRLSHRCTAALEDAGFSVKDQLGWVRTRATHRAQRLSVVYERRGDDANAEKWDGWKVGNLRPAFEPIIWFTKPYRIGATIADNVLSHGVGAYNEAAMHAYGGPNNFFTLGLASGEGGLHPTQKPVQLMRALVELVTAPGQVVMDPFAGSGTTLVAAQQLGREYLGCELSPEYVEVATTRLLARSDSLF